MADFGSTMKDFLNLCNEIGDKNYSLPEMVQYRGYTLQYVSNAKHKNFAVHHHDFDDLYEGHTRSINNGPETTIWLTVGNVFLTNRSTNTRINLTWFYNRALQKAEEAQKFISGLVESVREEETSKKPELKWPDFFLLHLYTLIHESSSSPTEKKILKSHMVTLQRKLGLPVDEAQEGMLSGLLEQMKSFGVELPEGMDLTDVKGLKSVMTGWLKQPDTMEMVKEAAKNYNIKFEGDPSEIVDKVLSSVQEFGKTDKGKSVIGKALDMAEKNLPGNLVGALKEGTKELLGDNEGTSGTSQ